MGYEEEMGLTANQIVNSTTISVNSVSRRVGRSPSSQRGSRGALDVDLVESPNQPIWPAYSQSNERWASIALIYRKHACHCLITISSHQTCRLLNEVKCAKCKMVYYMYMKTGKFKAAKHNAAPVFDRFFWQHGCTDEIFDWPERTIVGWFGSSSIKNARIWNWFWK